MQLVPQEVFLTRGIGTHKEQLISFELALRKAGIALQNLVTVSSIFPARCNIIPREEGIKRLTPGAITFCVLARQAVKEAGQHISAGIGLAIPDRKNICGYISEHHGLGMTREETEEYVENLAKELLATAIAKSPGEFPVLDVPLRPDGVPDLNYNTLNITQSAYTESSDTWTTVVAAAVFIL